MLDKLHNSGGGHEADLVSYLYGEMDPAARDRFELHLETCDPCAVELGAYADARLGVIEWRRNDFEHLATPAIIIPEPKHVTTLVAERPQSIWSAWVEAIYSLPRLVQAGIGLAAAAVLLSVFYFAWLPNISGTGPGTSKVAGETHMRAEPRKPEIAASPSQPEPATDQRKAEFKPAPVEIKDRRPAGAKPSDRMQRATVRQTPVMRNYRKLGPLEAVTMAPKAPTAPTLNTFDEEEDTTLRLSDLFSQVGPRKK